MSNLLEALVARDPSLPTWPQLMADALIPLKRDGWTFERSWSIAEAQYPAPLNWRRAHRGTETPYAFFRRHCEAAWTAEPTEAELAALMEGV